MHRIKEVRLSDEYVVYLQNVLGKGSTGCVYEGKNIKTLAKVAVKVIELKNICNQVTKYLLKMEKIAFMAIDNEYVVKGLKVIQDDKHCFLISEYCNGGTLRKQIKSNGCISQQKSLQIIKHILLGYLSLVDKKILHRDLKPANIMIHDNIPKIIDFGYCQIDGFDKPKLKYNVGSPSYMAPQSYLHHLYHQKSEIWAIGIILYQCLTGITIDNGRKVTEVYREIEDNGVKLPQHFSSTSVNIIQSCLHIDPMKRPSCSEILFKYFYYSQEKVKTNAIMQNLGNINFQSRKNSNVKKRQKQNIREIGNLQTKNRSPVQKISLVNCRVKDVLKNAKQRRVCSTHRQNAIKVSNPQHELYRKYFQTRTKTTFSSYQTQLHPMQSDRVQLSQKPHYKKQLQGKNIKQAITPRSTISNQYGLYRKSSMGSLLNNFGNQTQAKAAHHLDNNKNNSPCHSFDIKSFPFNII